MRPRLEDLPNVGPKLASGLRTVGVESPEALAAVGAVEAWDRLLAAGLFDCVNSISALEGAIRGIRWHDLDQETKASLAAHVKGATT